MTDTDQIASIPDPKDRAVAARDAQLKLTVAYQDERKRLMDITSAAIKEMRDGGRGMSLAKIAVLLDVTPGRVQQLENPK